VASALDDTIPCFRRTLVRLKHVLGGPNQVQVQVSDELS